MVLLQVEVPAGLYSGDDMTINYQGQDFSVVVPDGVAAGMLIELDLPVGEPSEPVAEENPTTEQVQIVIPDGLWPGDPFVVTTAAGDFEIAVPDGCGPGDTIEVTLPVPPPDAPASATATEKPAAEMAAFDARRAAAAEAARLAAQHELPPGYNPDDFEFKPGQRVEVWRTGDAYSGGTIVHGWEGWDGPHYKVRWAIAKVATPTKDADESTRPMRRRSRWTLGSSRKRCPRKRSRRRCATLGTYSTASDRVRAC